MCAAPGSLQIALWHILYSLGQFYCDGFGLQVNPASFGWTNYLLTGLQSPKQSPKQLRQSKHCPQGAPAHLHMRICFLVGGDYFSLPQMHPGKAVLDSYIYRGVEPCLDIGSNLCPSDSELASSLR